VPVSPVLALHQLMTGEREALEARHRSLQERCELLASVLSRYPALSAETGAPIPEHVEGAGPARQRLDQLTAGATREVLSFMPDLSDPTASLAPSRGSIVAVLERGVAFRRLYAEGQSSDVPILGDAEELIAAGAEVRLVPSLPIRLVVVDRQAAAVPVDLAAASAGVLVYHHVSPVSAMVALFEAYWNDARAVAGPDVPPDFTAAELSILRILASGAKADPAVSRSRWLQIWSSQLHMLLNRLGLLPDEERSLSWFIVSCLQAPHGSTDFFDDHVQASDRRYLEASSFAASRMSWQQPRDVMHPASQPRYNPYARPAVPLPAEPLPQVSLGQALAGRACARGDLGGPVRASELGTLLWSSYATISDPRLRAGRPHRPYPSAGAQYVARLRLIVRAVSGLDPGLYEVDQAGRRLMPLSPAPDDGELAASSMWFGPQSPEVGRVDLAVLPAMLGLYVELTALRARYGLRALRFALAEAGHLAQNLTLVAAAAGLSAGVIGGFYDDVAHEVFMLDGVDDVLVYLMPVGRQRRVERP
jgi:SagB-type dehydrogenase family enzyme